MDTLTVTMKLIHSTLCSECTVWHSWEFEVQKGLSMLEMFVIPVTVGVHQCPLTVSQCTNWSTTPECSNWTILICDPAGWGPLFCTLKIQVGVPLPLNELTHWKELSLNYNELQLRSLVSGKSTPECMLKWWWGRKISHVYMSWCCGGSTWSLTQEVALKISRFIVKERCQYFTGDCLFLYTSLERVWYCMYEILQCKMSRFTCKFGHPLEMSPLDPIKLQDWTWVNKRLIEHDRGAM